MASAHLNCQIVVHPLMDEQIIINQVDEAIDQLCEEFSSNPDLFFTENDLVCRFYHLLMKTLEPSIVQGPGKGNQLLVHTEYPTPFRCDMENGRCILMGDDDVTSGSKKFKRGHYDVAILNPAIVTCLSNEDLRFQDFKASKELLASLVRDKGPVILYGLEFQYKRGKLTDNDAQVLAKLTLQDHEKLAIGSDPPRPEHACPSFVGRYQSLVFFHDCSQVERITIGVRGREGIRLCYP